MNWIISANPNEYDVVSAFNKYKFIDWRQSMKPKVGDIIYIYCSKPIGEIKFKCVVEDVNIPWQQVNDSDEFWVNQKEYLNLKTRNFMRLCLQQQIDSEQLSFKNLKENGLKGNIQGPIRLDSKIDLLSYIENVFDKNTSLALLLDEDLEQFPIFEGNRKNIVINRYERSSLAREKCIAYHGCYCHVCELDFEETYGSLGKGFIHVHHKIPLSQIGEDYEVDYVNDLIPVCPNCHAMIHRKSINGAFTPLEELKRLVKGKEFV